MAGGIYCGITDDGTLKKIAYDKKGTTYTKHPNSNIPFEDVEVPGFTKSVKFCINHHKKLFRLTFISWDIAIGKDDNPRFIEMNLRRQSIYGHQIVNGPLFGKYTEDIIEKYKYEKEKEPIIY